MNQRIMNEVKGKFLKSYSLNVHVGRELIIISIIMITTTTTHLHSSSTQISDLKCNKFKRSSRNRETLIDASQLCHVMKVSALCGWWDGNECVTVIIKSLFAGLFIPSKWKGEERANQVQRQRKGMPIS